MTQGKKQHETQRGPTGFNAADARRGKDNSVQKMAAEGEIAAENLGDATISNKYNSSTRKVSPR